jgi:membrane protease subunit HflK
MPHEHDTHKHRNLETAETSFDVANQSLADALRASFSVLKGIMVVLVVLYLITNVRSIDAHEEALSLRLGKLRKVVDRPGLVWAFPFPIDEIVPLPTKKSNDILITSHTLYRTDQEKGKPISFIQRGPAQGLDPALDGALLTADAGLVHVQWKLTYKIDNVADYVTNIAGDKVEAAEKLIKTLVETIGIQIASELTAEEVIRTRVNYVQGEMRRRINERLVELESGVDVTFVEMYEPTPPVQIRRAFDATQSAESIKKRKIDAARQERTRVLNEAAGSAHTRLVDLLDGIDQGGVDGKSVEELRAKLDDLLENEVAGEAGRRIREAGAYRAEVISQMESDVAEYKTLLPEYQRNPMMLINRLWQEARQRIFASEGVTKVFRPHGLREFRLTIPRDPEERRIEEERRLEKKDFDPSTLRQERMVPIGPGP